MSRCVTKIHHDECNKNNLQIFADEEGKIDGYCFSCNTYVSDPFGEGKSLEDLPDVKVKTDEEIQEEIDEIGGFKTVDLPYRKLREAQLSKFNVKVALSEVDGKTPTVIYYPYTKDGKLTGYKAKTTGSGKSKKTWWVGTGKGVDLFGWEEALKSSSRKLIITEGEEDAVAMTAIIDRFTKSEYQDNKPAVVSLPHGTNSTQPKTWKNLVTKIQKSNFSDIILCFDQDEAGEKAVKAAQTILPDCLVSKLPDNDANACIMNGKGKAAFNSVMFKADKPKNTRLIRADEIYEEAAIPAEFGELSWPWKTLNSITRGIRYGETIYLGAGVKMGKSELADEIAAHLIQVHKVPILAIKPEQANKLTVKKIAGKIAGKVFHDPKVKYDTKEFLKYSDIVGRNLYLINLYQHVGWETLKVDIRQAVAAGCKAVFIDPITNLTNGLSSSDANTKLQEIAQELSAMALDLNIVIFIFCHLKSPEGTINKETRRKYYEKGMYIGLGNCPHESGGDVVSSQVAGSRAMMRSCNYMIGLEGNKDPELPDDVKNIRNLKLLEDREFGESAIIPLYWNPNTTRFKEI